MDVRDVSQLFYIETAALEEKKLCNDLVIYYAENFVMKNVAWYTYELCGHGLVLCSLLVLLHEGGFDVFAACHVNMHQNNTVVVRHQGYSLRLQNDRQKCIYICSIIFSQTQNIYS